MSSDFTNSKKGTHSVYPQSAIDTANGIDRVEPLLSTREFRDRFTFGFPLVSPLTKEEVTNKMIKTYINRAANLFEFEAQIDVAPVIRRHRLPFDPNLYRERIFLEVPNKPIQNVIQLAIISAGYSEEEEAKKYPSGGEIYTIPRTWIEMGNANRGALNVNPINPAFSAATFTSAASASGAGILQFIGQTGWVPAFWQVECVHGIGTADGKVPTWVNEAIGSRAMMLLIQDLLPLFRIQSQSLSADGLSQSVSNSTPQLLQMKFTELEKNYNAIVKRSKTMYNNKFFSSNV